MLSIEEGSGCFGEQDLFWVGCISVCSGCWRMCAIPTKGHHVQRAMIGT